MAGGKGKGSGGKASGKTSKVRRQVSPKVAWQKMTSILSESPDCDLVERKTSISSESDTTTRAGKSPEEIEG